MLKRDIVGCAFGASHIFKVLPLLIRKTNRMRQRARLFFFLLFLFSFTLSWGADRYSVKLTEKGNMYFFMPYKLKGTTGGRFEYDMTLLSSRDSVSINMTLSSPLGRVQSVRLSSGEINYATSRYELYYQERRGSVFRTRIHIDCPMHVYRQLFDNSSPLVIEIRMKDGKRYSFGYKEKRWKKETAFVNEVLEMIAYDNENKISRQIEK